MKILICGDYIAGNNISVRGAEIFGKFIDVIRSCDIRIYNQEHPITCSEEIYSTKRYGTTDNCNPELLSPIIEAGFNYVSLANNHIFNRGVSGLSDTIKFFNKHGIKSFGAGSNLYQAREILYVEKNKYKLSFLSFAENEFSIATDYHGGANPLNIIDNVNQIKEARAKSDFVFVIIHGGLEYCHYPTPRMIKQYRFYVENGASAVICHHSHVVSGFEIYNNSPIFYGIGNFIPLKHLNKTFKQVEARTSIAVQFEISGGNLLYKYYPLRFSIDLMQLEFIEGYDLMKFESKFSAINSKLNDLHEIRKGILSTWFDEEKRSYYYTLFTRSNYLLFKLFRKIGFLHLYNYYIARKMRLNKRNAAIWNLVRCETHRDVLDLIFENEVDLYRNEKIGENDYT